MWHMFGNYGYVDGGWALFGGMLMLIFPVIFILLFVWLVYAVVNKESEKTGGERPKEGQEIRIVKGRYAKGEITKEQYEEIIKTLKK